MKTDHCSIRVLLSFSPHTSGLSTPTQISQSKPLGSPARPAAHQGILFPEEPPDLTTHARTQRNLHPQEGVLLPAWEMRNQELNDRIATCSHIAFPGAQLRVFPAPLLSDSETTI